MGKLTYNEEKFNKASAQLDLAKLGFSQIVKDTIKNAKDEDYADLFFPYVEAIADLQESVEYYRTAVENERKNG